MRSNFKSWAATIFVLLFMAGATYAQQTISGIVVDVNEEPLIGASISVKGTTVGTVTDLEGKYTLTVPEGMSVIQIAYLGYASQDMAIEENTYSRITLQDDQTKLDEVVITGLASTIKRRNLANSVARVESKELTGISTQSTFDKALYGKFKGADIRSNSGAPGGGLSMRLRGVTSIFGDQQPLYIVDGIYVSNATISSGTNLVSEAADGGNTATNQDDASNRVADLDPEDIESIEILKGASAAAIYGSRAAGGVVIITTKKGTSGKTKLSLAQTAGFSQATRLLGDRGWDAAKVEEAFGEEERARFEENGYNNYEEELYGRNAPHSTTRLNISGGTEKTNFFLGGTYKNEQGIVVNTGYEKYAARVNIGHKLTKWADLYFTNNYIVSTADRGFFNNGNTNTTVGYASAFTRPWDNLQAVDGVFPGNPRVGSNILETVSDVTNREKVNRYLGGLTATFKVFSNQTNSLKAVFRGGLDQYALRTTALFPSSLSFFRSEGSLGGAHISGSTISLNTNISAFLVHSLYTSSGLSFSTQVGVTQENFDLNTVTSTATGLLGSQTNITQSTITAASQNIQPSVDKGAFIQEEININDKVVITAGLRADKSSNNGDANQLYFYPKGNIAVNIHEFADFGDGISQLKIRGAFGQSGRFPVFNARFNSLGATSVAGLPGWETPTVRGNPNIEPERQSELEFGLDFGLLRDRILLDATYYIKSIDDVLLRSSVQPSQGFTSQWVNAGALENNGIELGLNAVVIDNTNLDWRTSLNWWKNTSEITRLEVPAFPLGGFAASLGQYYIQEGFSATQIVGSYNPDNCAQADCSDLDPEGDGLTVYGDGEADFNLSWLNNINFKGLELSFLWHWKQGGDGINLSTLLWDLGELTWDYDDKTLDPSGELGNGEYRVTSWNAGDASPWIEDASYIRLREVGLYYTIPAGLYKGNGKLRLGFSGNNLVNIFDYNSYDPEVSNFGNNVLANTVEVTPFPASRRLNFHISATF